MIGNLIQGLLNRLLLLAVSAPSDTDIQQALNKSQEGSNNVVKFYQYWRNELNGEWGLFHAVAGWFQNGLVKFVYHIDDAFESVFNGMFSLLGWDGTLSSSSSPIHSLYMFFYTVGWALLGASLIVIVLQSIGHTVKWAKILPNVVMVALSLTILPLMMRTVGNAGGTPGLGDITLQAKSDISSASDRTMTGELAIQPIKNNVFDLNTEIRRGWKDSPNGSDMAKANAIRDKSDVENLNLGQFMDKTTLKKLGLDKDPYKKDTAVLNYHLLDESGQPGNTSGTGYFIVKNENGLGMKTLNDYTYARYKVNWVALLGQSIILAVLLIVSAIRVVKDIFELTMMNLVAPILAYKSTRDPKQLRDLINSIIGLYISLVLMLAVLRMFFVFISVAPGLLPKMTGFEKGLAVIVIYGGATWACFAGVSYFERITGVSQGFADEAGQAMALGAIGGSMAGLAARGAGFGLSKAFGGHSTSNGHTSTASSMLGGNSNSSGIYGNTSDSKTDSSTTGGHSDSQSKGGLYGSQSSSQSNDKMNGQSTTDSKASSQGNSSVNANNASDANSDNTANSSMQAEDNGQNINGQSSNVDTIDNGHGIGQMDDGNIDGNDNPDTIDGPASGIEGENDANAGFVSDDGSMSGTGVDANDSATDNGTWADNVGGAIDSNPYAPDPSEIDSDVNGQGFNFGDPANSASGINDPDINSDTVDMPSSGIGDDNGMASNADNYAPDATQTTNPVGGDDYGNYSADPSTNQEASISGTSDPSSVTSEQNFAPQGNATPGLDHTSSESKVGNHIAHAGDIMNKAGKFVEQRSNSYLTGNRFNMSQNGHAHGANSSRFDDE